MWERLVRGHAVAGGARGSRRRGGGGGGGEALLPRTVYSASEESV